MATYAFILGRKSLLSVAEIAQVIKQDDKIIDIGRESLVVELKDDLEDPQSSLDQLGGTIKIIKIFEDNASKGTVAESITKYLFTKFENHSGKLNYGISIYSFAQGHDNILKETLNKTKKELSKKGVKSRFVNHNFKNLENAAIKGEKLIKEGSEIVILQGKNKIFAGETVALQDFENYSNRDYNRPARDAKLGMLPPKLSQIMINLTGKSKLQEKNGNGVILYDPFVGVGTVLSEGILMGYEVIGSDIDGEVIKKAQQNLDWIKVQSGHESTKIELFIQDAKYVNKKSLPKSPDIIVTESYLGPPVSQVPTTENMNKTFQNIRETVTAFFKSIHPLLKSRTPIVISLLFYRTKDRFYSIENLVGKIMELGFEVAPLIPEELKSEFRMNLNERQSLMYDRPDQIVGREIWKFIRI